MKNSRKPEKAFVRLLFLVLTLCMIVGLSGCIFIGPFLSGAGGRVPVFSEPVNITSETEKETEEPTESITVPEDDIFQSRDDIAYILIYNPYLYDEELENNEKLSTGSFGKWIDVSLFRGGEEEKELPFEFYSQSELDQDIDDLDIDLSGSRASVPQPDFKVGDKKDFYYGSGAYLLRKGSFTCVSVGDHCCIWTPEDTEPDMAALYRIMNEFDNRIYPADVSTFGTPRYSDVNGKIHIIFHSMGRSLLGFFRAYDLFTHDEADDSTAELNKMNRDLAIIHVNSDMLENPSYEEAVCSTIAHELQHLINFTDYIEYNGVNYSGTWINESMSGYIEEKLYPGIKDFIGHYQAFAISDLIRHGQSMYNFDTGFLDIGVYGSVFLFSQYLENLAGETVFKTFHDYWRSTYEESALNDAAALYGSVPQGVADRISEKYDFSQVAELGGKEQIWLSKLTLDFYLSLLQYDPSDPEAYQNVRMQSLLYDEINPAEIEGGGRVIAATRDGHFEISNDSDHPLIYIGFDRDFNQITDVIIR